MNILYVNKIFNGKLCKKNTINNLEIKENIKFTGLYARSTLQGNSSFFSIFISDIL